MQLSPLSPPAPISTTAPSAAAEGGSRPLRIGLVLVVNLGLAVAVVQFFWHLPGNGWGWPFSGSIAAHSLLSAPRCIAVSSGMLTALAIRRQWLGLLLAGLVSVLDGYAAVFALWTF